MYRKCAFCFILSVLILLGVLNPAFVKGAQLAEEIDSFATTNVLDTYLFGDAQTYSSLVPETARTRQILCTTTTSYCDVGSAEKGCRIEVSAPNLQLGQIVSINLCDENPYDRSEIVRIKNTSQKAVFYLNKTSRNFLLKTVLNQGKVNLNVVVSSVTPMAGSSFSKAVAISSGDSCTDVLGFNTMTDKSHYYKINVPKEKLVKINLKKKESSASRDIMCVDIYKSTNKDEVVTSGVIYEGQSSAYIYIRNSSKRQTLPGTYYIVVNKSIMESGFEYTITY